MFEHLPSIPQGLIENSYKDVESIVFDPGSLLLLMEVSNPQMAKVVRETAATMALSVDVDEPKWQEYLEFYTTICILVVLRFVDKALEAKAIEAKLK